MQQCHSWMNNFGIFQSDFDFEDKKICSVIFTFFSNFTDWQNNQSHSLTRAFIKVSHTDEGLRTAMHRCILIFIFLIAFNQLNNLIMGDFFVIF